MGQKSFFWRSIPQNFTLASAKAWDAGVIRDYEFDCSGGFSNMLHVQIKLISSLCVIMHYFYVATKKFELI